MIKTLKAIYSILDDLIKQIDERRPHTVDDIRDMIVTKRNSIAALAELCASGITKKVKKKKKP